MEVLKTISNLEFELIYADGTRRRVKEGILYEAEDSGDMIFHNGTDQPAVLLAAAECALVSLNQIGPGLEALVVGMALTEEPRAALERLVKFGSKLLKLTAQRNRLASAWDRWICARVLPPNCRTLPAMSEV